MNEANIKEKLISQLLQSGFYKMDDGRQLYELSVDELKDLVETRKKRV